MFNSFAKMRANATSLTYADARMYPPVDTKDPRAVEVEVQAAYLAIFPNGDRDFVPMVFGWAQECFTGAYKDYQAVDARYHDFEHTLQGALCMARLLRGRHAANAHPQLTPRMVQLGVIAILLHDSGYLKKRDDTEGTGAKYTVTHVDRGAKFAVEFLTDKRVPVGDIRAVENMIHCTGVDAALSVIPFQNETEKIVGHALGTADLLGQMAAEDYVDKLPALYGEFAEAVRYSEGKPHFISMFSSAADLMQKTPAFWEKFVQLKLNRDFGGLYRFLNDPYPHGPNYYLDRIEANMERLRQRGATVKS
jgi:hypothetical protein